MQQTELNRQSSKRRMAALLVFALLAAAVLVDPRGLATAMGGEPPQRRRGTTGGGQRRPQTSRPRGINYARFSHDLNKDYHVKYDKNGRANCDSCHKLNSPLQYDIKDFPDHPACVGCHRQQFFTGARPAICTVCHKVSSPRDDRRFQFPKPSADVTREFPGRFPHGLHQNLLARARPAGEPLADSLFVRASFASQSTAQQERRQENCALCHASYDKTKKGEEGFFPAAKWPDNMLPGVGTFRKIPDGREGHRTCFVCHASSEKGWRSPEPVAENCAGCHGKTTPGGQAAADPQPSASPGAAMKVRPLAPPMKVSFTSVLLPSRKVLTFQHEGGGEGGSHQEGCTTCHINITQEQTFVVKPDVPISSCALCHISGGKESSLRKVPPGGSKVTLTTEMEAWSKSKTACLSCHTPEIGSRPPPCSHYYADRKVPPAGIVCQ